MDVLSGAYWDIGLRSVNEDTLLYEDIYIKDIRVVLALVADGVGSLKNGQIASGYIGESIAKCFFNDIKNNISKGYGISKIKKLLLKKIYEIHLNLKEYTNHTNMDIASTLSLILIINGRYLIMHLGDSAIYKCKKNTLKLLVPFHRNLDGSVSKCISNICFHKPYIKTGFIRNNTGFLVCTDGFYKRFPKDIRTFNPKDILTEEQIEKRLISIGEYVFNKGEKDNKSAVYFLIR